MSVPALRKGLDEVVAPGQDQGVGVGVVEGIYQGRQIGSGLGRQQTCLAIGQVKQLQPVRNREINHRHHIIAFAGGNHAAGSIGGVVRKVMPSTRWAPGKITGSTATAA